MLRMERGFLRAVLPLPAKVGGGPGWGVQPDASTNRAGGSTLLRVYRLAAFDLDGTLLNSANAMSATNAAALASLVARDVAVVAATARPYLSAMRHFEPYGLAPAAIASAGADVRLVDGTVVAQWAMADEFALFLAALADRADWTATLTTQAMTYRREAPGAPATGNRGYLRVVRSLREADLSGLMSALIHAAPGDQYVAELEAWDGRVSVHRAVSFDGSPLLTVTAPGVDKGRGLRALCERLDIGPAECVAFGDSEVDIPMFREAGLAVVTANGTREALAAAGMVTASADDDGVAQAVAALPWKGPG